MYKWKIQMEWFLLGYANILARMPWRRNNVLTIKHSTHWPGYVLQLKLHAMHQQFSSSTSNIKHQWTKITSYLDVATITHQSFIIGGEAYVISYYTFCVYNQRRKTLENGCWRKWGNKHFQITLTKYPLYIAHRKKTE